MQILRAAALRRLALGALLAASSAVPAAAQAPGSDEERTARRFDAIRDQPPHLVAFLRAMPKGGDLHSHLSGAVYAESYVEWAAEAGLCVRRGSARLSPPPCDSAAGQVPAAQALRDAALRGEMIDAWSTRNWHPARESGHDRFFDTFGGFGAAGQGRTGDMLAEATRRAALGRVSYLELMLTPDGGGVAALGAAAGWRDADDEEASFRRLRERLLATGLRDTLVAAARALDRAEARQRELLRCGTRQASMGCTVTVRYLYQVSRGRPPANVFAQILAGFEMATADARVVGFNLVQPEDGLLSMRDYSLHMRMIAHLRRLYPGVRVTLHAGELAPGLVPPEGLRSHVREAVEVAGASRIGHGVDVMHEYDPYGLLRTMAERGVLVEIALTSNDVILGVKGADHPLRAYMEAGVPVALATDDEGVARSEMTMEYLKAAREQGLGYVQLKAMARNSLEHAFVEGESVWRDRDALLPVAACTPEAGGFDGCRCHAFRSGSRKASLQAALEVAFAAFEREQAMMAAGREGAPAPR
jgi:adenosine deaminase